MPLFIFCSSSSDQGLLRLIKSASSFVASLGTRAPLLGIGNLPMYRLNNRRFSSLLRASDLQSGGSFFHHSRSRGLLLRPSLQPLVFQIFSISNLTVFGAMPLLTTFLIVCGACSLLSNHKLLLAWLLTLSAFRLFAGGLFGQAIQLFNKVRRVRCYLPLYRGYLQ